MAKEPEKRKKTTRKGPQKGRRSRYRGAADDQAAAVVARMGGTNAQIAAALNVSERTLDRWLIEQEDLREAVAAGKADFDTDTVERSLLRRAMGYDYDEVTRELGETKEMTPDGPLTTPVMVETRRIRKHEPANVTAAIFWLCNRRPDKWRQRQEHQVTVSLPEITVKKTYEKAEQAAGGKG